MLSGIEMPQIKDIDWYALIDTLLGDLQIEYDIDVTANHLTIKAARNDVSLMRTQLEKAFSALPSVLPYRVEVAPLQETIPEALSHFKALLGHERFADIAFNPNELFNDKKGASIENGVLYSKPTTNKRTISVWTDALNALVADLGTHTREQLKALWKNSTPISRESLDFSEGDINFEDIVKQNFGMRIDAQNQVCVFFNYRQLWQDLFVPELAIKSTVVSAPKLHDLRNNTALTIHKAQLLDYLRQELHSDMLWRFFQTNDGPMATPIYLDSTRLTKHQTKVSIVIDRSGSMKNIFDKLTDNIITFIDKLEPNTEVNILFFDDKIGPRKSFRAHELKAITEFVKSLRPQGSTYLYRALNVEMNELLKTAIAGDNSAILLLTDGEDATNNASAEIEGILASQRQFKNHDIKIPKIFTIGVGDERYIQKIDERLASERLIINTVGEFDRVFKYIQEIQYPSREHELVVTTKPGQISAYKVTIAQNGEGQSPGIYLPCNHSSFGLIDSHKKQIIRLKGTPPEANAHDEVKGILARAHEIIVSANYRHKQADVNELKAAVNRLILAKQTAYGKSVLENLIPVLEGYSAKLSGQSLPETVTKAQSERKFIEYKATFPSFTMEYATTQQGLIGHFNGAGLPLAAPHYNIAGKLITAVTQPVSESLAPMQMTTRISSQQDQMTVHSQDNNGTELKRVYADCQPLVDEFTETPFLYCQGENFQSFVFPHETTFNSQGDNYDLNTCRPVSYYGNPSVVCQGEKSSVVVTPNLPVRPFEHLSENIALGAVLIYWCKKIYEAFTRPTQEPAPQTPKNYLTDKNVLTKITKKIASLLNITKDKIELAKPFEGAEFHLAEIDEFNEKMAKLEGQFEKGVLKKSKLDALSDAIKHFKADIVETCDTVIAERAKSTKQLTPQLSLEKPRDWSQLLVPKPTARHPVSDLQSPRRTK